jgi:transposase
LRECAVRVVAEVSGDYDSVRAAMNAVAEKLGVGTGETMPEWVRQVERSMAGVRPAVTTEEPMCRSTRRL